MNPINRKTIALITLFLALTNREYKETFGVF